MSLITRWEDADDQLLSIEVPYPDGPVRVAASDGVHAVEVVLPREDFRELVRIVGLGS